MAKAVQIRIRAVVVFIAIILIVGYLLVKNHHGIYNNPEILAEALTKHKPYPSIQPCSDLFSCPDMRMKPNVNVSQLRQSQLILTRMLRIFALICEKHNVRYFLYRGTLLGAARHRGHNPLDNDIDVGIPESDYSKLVSAIKADLPYDMFFQSEATDPYYKTPPRSSIIAKLRDRKSCYTDVICKENCHQNGLQIDISVLSSDGNGNLLDYYSSTSYILRLFRGPLGYKESDIFPLSELEFDGFRFWVPRMWRQFLVNWYGDSYMTMPTPGNRYKVFSGSTVDNTHSCEEIRRTQKLY